MNQVLLLFMVVYQGHDYCSDTQDCFQDFLWQNFSSGIHNCPSKTQKLLSRNDFKEFFTKKYFWGTCERRMKAFEALPSIIHSDCNNTGLLFFQTSFATV